jgi:hypothetical protein
MVSSSAYGFGSGAVTESRGCAGLVSGIRQQLILQLDLARLAYLVNARSATIKARVANGGTSMPMKPRNIGWYQTPGFFRKLSSSIRSGMVRNKELYRQGRLSSGWGCTLQFWRNGAQIGAIHIRAEQERIYLHSPRRSTGRQRPTADRPAAQGLLQQGRNAARFRYRSRCHCQERVEAVLSR